jgi:cytochrome P450 PksS
MALDTKLQLQEQELELQSDPATGELNGAPLLLDMMDPHYRQTSQETFNELRARCPVAHVQFAREGDGDDQPRGPFQREAYLITRYDDGNAALLDNRVVVDPRHAMSEEQVADLERPSEEFRVLRRNLLSIDPPDHTRLRKLVQPSFTNRQMETLRPRIQAIADELIDKAEREAAARGETAPNRQIELISAFSFPMPIQVICELLGIPAEDQAEVERLFLALPIGGGRPETQEEIRATFQELTDYLNGLVERKRQAPTGDLISELVHAEEDGDTLNGEELLSMIFILLAAGHVTTVNLITSGVFALLSHPEQLAKMKEDPELVKNAVEEILRYYGPLDTTLPRFASEDLTIDGARIPKGETVLIGLASANHDPERFVDPDAFNITREDANRHVAFGKGIHVCLGAPLARLEGQIALTTLFARMPEMRLAVPSDEITWRPGFLRQLSKLPLVF